MGVNNLTSKRINNRNNNYKNKTFNNVFYKGKYPDSGQRGYCVKNGTRKTSSYKRYKRRTGEQYSKENNRDDKQIYERYNRRINSSNLEDMNDTFYSSKHRINNDT
ncbi:conserved Plasmodium protein, unknown function [Plasmodium ovale wallikeri]|uniref:Uncharacterized protein n=1 Tax=Plasmodium ovale wallikeri TaxID=864142 RepID=A0A1A8YZQ2_PLAOA|nr:conserved Plasmodium protein, unknown function [Plasmodium ovale wallikeri]SBT37626.1 conserved Plasmodium protein, unknown function [Plasmodium ovale wallikeri]